GHYGQFAPALAQGFAGFQQGQQQVIDDRFKKAQAEQMQALRNMQMQTMSRKHSQEEEAQNIISSGIDPQSAMRHANPHVRDWARGMVDVDYRDRALSARGSGASATGLVPTTQGYAYRDEQGNTQFLTGADGKPLMPVSYMQYDPKAQYTKNYSGEQGKIDGKSDANYEANYKAAQNTLNSTFFELDRMKSAAEELLAHDGLKSNTGFRSMIPNRPGSRAQDADSNLQQLKSQIGFAVLQAMREASKTGGALGSVSEGELYFLQNNLASLDKAQSYEQLKKELKKIIKYVEDSKAKLSSAFENEFNSGSDELANILGL
ncbi:hypothetical protein, partial [Oligella urethralis]